MNGRKASLTEIEIENKSLLMLIFKDNNRVNLDKIYSILVIALIYVSDTCSDIKMEKLEF